jgi:hypothetical protein
MARLSAKLLTKLTTQLDRRTEITTLIKELEAEKKAIDAAMGTFATDAGGAIETDRYKVTMVNGMSTKLDKAKLLELGVRPTVIEKATVSTPFTYPKITAKKVDVA